MDRPPLGDAECIIDVVFVVVYDGLDDDCCLGSVSGHSDLVNDLTSQISGNESDDADVVADVCLLEDGFAVIVTSGFPPVAFPVPER